MNFLIFSDVHGNISAFESFLKCTVDLRSDHLTVFLGDFIGYYYDPDDIISFCRENSVVSLIGNHDQYFLRLLDNDLDEKNLTNLYGSSYTRALATVSEANIAYLRMLPDHKIYELDGASIFMSHGSPLNFTEGRLYPDTDLGENAYAAKEFDYIICGHTHYRMKRKYGLQTFLNPGSLGQSRDGQGSSFMTLDTIKGLVSFYKVTYDDSHLRSQITLYDPENNYLSEILTRKVSMSIDGE